MIILHDKVEGGDFNDDEGCRILIKSSVFNSIGISKPQEITSHTMYKSDHKIDSP